MSSTDPPSRIPPRQQPHETKSARDELSSKGKVEKVRAVDPDEETRKKKFLKYYKDQDLKEEGSESRPSPFELYSQKPDVSEKRGPQDFGDVEDAIVPSPNYTPPPNIGVGSGEKDNQEDALPRSDDFWDDVDLPDQPLPSSQLQETPHPARKGPISPFEKKIQEEEKAKLEKGLLTPPKKGADASTMKKKPAESPPFELPSGKVEPAKKQKAQEKTPSDFEQTAQQPPPPPISSAPPLAARREEKPLFEKKKPKEERPSPESPAPIQIQGEKRFEEETPFGKKEKGQKPVEILSPALPTLPPEIAPMALASTNQLTTYLNPNTFSLFYQIVGTIFIAQSQSGVVRTEIVLNNPAYSDSKFYGSTITIEKYATAPDSFNIRLSGSHQAVVAFKENIPSLMNAFQNGNFSFKVNRLDAEYALERPVFRRKERRNESGGGDLGERRK